MSDNSACWILAIITALVLQIIVGGAVTELKLAPSTYNGVILGVILTLLLRLLLKEAK